MSSLRSFVLIVICLAALPTLGLPEDDKDATSVLSNAAKALGMDRLKTLNYSGSGSSYVVTQGPVPTGGWPHSVMKSYGRDLNLEAMTSRLQLIRTEGTPAVEKTLTHEIDANSPWSSQYELWITPHGFLKGAMANKAAMESKTVMGTAYRAVTFTLPGGHKVVGYINDKNFLERVETWIGGNDSILVEALFRDYTDFNGVKFPALIMEKRGGELSLILIVRAVKS